MAQAEDGANSRAWSRWLCCARRGRFRMDCASRPEVFAFTVVDARRRRREGLECIVLRHTFPVVAAEKEREVVTAEQQPAPEPLTKRDFEALARFRFGIRRYLRFSEETVRRHGLTPQHYQLLLALKGFPGRDWATLAELAERLQLRHHSVVELVNRAQKQGLVERALHPVDARAVRVELTDDGQLILSRLSAMHRDELQRLGPTLALPIWEDPPQDR